jgi:ABC-type antimicrobial peptide transport system permease subunit
LAIIISLLGVIGLVALSIQRRLKEIGVRKVLGASSLNITTLFIKEFSLVFGLACLLACPLAYYFMNNWLDNYANRISLTPFTFLWAVIGLMSITAILIGVQTFKSATMNPVKSLKTE